MVYFFVRALSTARRYIKCAQIFNITNQAMHHPMKEHSGIDRRSIIYFLHRKIMRRYSQWSIYGSINDI